LVVIVQVRVWLPLAEQAFQAVHVQVSAVQAGGVVVVGVQDCVVAGLGVVTPVQSVVMLQERVWPPLAEQAFQSVQDHVSAVQEGEVEGAVQDWVVAGLGVVTPAQSAVIRQLRAWFPLVEHMTQSVQDHVSAVQEVAPPPVELLPGTTTYRCASSTVAVIVPPSSSLNWKKTRSSCWLLVLRFK
jgi:hypothetical protein